MENKKEKGFTLIELLIVIGIIAILAAAVIIAINPGQQFKQARNATRWSHMNSVVNATYSYMISAAGSFPDCLYDSGTGAVLEVLVDISECSGADHLDPHIADLPMDPQRGGSTYAAITKVSGDYQINGESYGVKGCTGVTCTGYLIGLTGVANNRLMVSSIATEAMTEDIAVIQ